MKRVVVGHRPVGDSPALLRAAAGGVEVVMADTSFADVAAPDKRGASLVVATFEGDDLERTATRIVGSRADGASYEVRLPVPGDDADADDVLGTVDADGWWCKARCEDGFLFSRGDGRKVEYDLRP